MNLRQSQIELLKELRDCTNGEIVRWRVEAQSDSFERLVSKGLIDKGKFRGYAYYKITHTGLAELKRLESK